MEIKYYLMGAKTVGGPWEPVYVFDEYPLENEIAMFSTHDFFQVQKVWELVY